MMESRFAKALRVLAILLGALAPGWGSVAAGPTFKSPRTDVVDQIIRCADISDMSDRVVCYDAAVQSLRQARAQHVFDGERRSPPEFENVDSTISAIAQSGYGMWLLVLADHSVWQTTEVSRFEPVSGSAIRIRRGALGGLRAAIGDQLPVSVQRLR